MSNSADIRPQLHDIFRPAVAEVDPLVTARTERLQQALFGNERPDAIVFATASKRKVFLIWFIMSLIDPSFPLEKCCESLNIEPPPANLRAMTPGEFQIWIEANIFNGDGALAHGTSVQVGSFLGIPIFLTSQNGETADNHNPAEQSHLKIKAVLPLHQDLKRILFVASDTVGGLMFNGTTRYAGKPAKLSDWPETLTAAEVAQLAPTELNQHVTHRLGAELWYLLNYYTPIGEQVGPLSDWLAKVDQIFAKQPADLQDESAIRQKLLDRLGRSLIGEFSADATQIIERHINSLVVLLAVAGESGLTTVRTLLDQITELRVTIPQVYELVDSWLRGALVIYPQSGGAGGFQQQVDLLFAKPEDFMKGQDVDLSQHFQDRMEALLSWIYALPGQEGRMNRDQLQGFLLRAHFMGVSLPSAMLVIEKLLAVTDAADLTTS